MKMCMRFLWVGTLLAASPLVAADDARLSKKQETLVEQVVPAYEAGDPARLLMALSGAVATLDESHLTAADNLLAEHRVPSIVELLGQTRLTLLSQGLADQLPRPNSRELLLTLRALDDQIQPVLQFAGTHPALADPLPQPENMTAYQQLFWSIHVLDNQLKNVAGVVKYADQLSQQAGRLNQDKLSAADKQLLKADYGELAQLLELTQRELEEREMELRLHRLTDAEAVLSQSVDTKERLLAAHAVEMDSDLLIEFLDVKDREWVRQELQDPELKNRVKSIADRARKVAGDKLLEKGELLAVGLHWWLRGRYGAGPNAFGLVKAESAVLSPQNQFPLLMPIARPQPTNPAEDGSVTVPQVDRRHHYTWAAEYRPIVSSAGPMSSKSTSRTTTGPFVETEQKITHMSRFY